MSFLSPLQIIKALPLSRGMRVADFGTGPGVCATALLEKIGTEGAVYAFDVLPEQVEALHRKVVHQEAGNLFPLCTDLNQHIPLKDALLDASLIINTFHALSNRDRFLSELHRVTARGGSVLMVDWAASFKNIGPAETAVIGPGDAVRFFKSHGFQVGDMLPAGTHHYGFVARRL